LKKSGNVDGVVELMAHLVQWGQLGGYRDAGQCFLKKERIRHRIPCVYRRVSP
jgi:hypothetical protein